MPRKYRANCSKSHYLQAAGLQPKVIDKLIDPSGIKNNGVRKSVEK
jgi:hypothetical protein